MLEYLVTKKEGIAHFIYKVIPLLSIDIDKEIVYKVIKQYILKVSNIYTRYILDLYFFFRFNSYSIKLATLKLYNYNSLEKIVIRRVEKYFIKRLNIVALDTISTPMRISFIYTLYIIGLSLNL